MQFRYPRLGRKHIARTMKSLAKKEIANQAVKLGSKFVDPSGRLGSAIQVAQDGSQAVVQAGKMAGNLMRR